MSASRGESVGELANAMFVSVDSKMPTAKARLKTLIVS